MNTLSVQCLIREPKYTHLKNLHKAIKMSEPALVSSDPRVTKLGSKQEAHVFSSNSGPCAAFLANYDTSSSVTAPSGNPKMTPVTSFSWQSYMDETPSAGDDITFSADGLYEQLNVTRDASDYLCVNVNADEGFLNTGNNPTLTVMSSGHTLHVFINGELADKQPWNPHMKQS